MGRRSVSKGCLRPPTELDRMLRRYGVYTFAFFLFADDGKLHRTSTKRL